MLNETRLEMYLVAYTTRLQRGEKLEDIDELYLNEGRIKQIDIDQIHSELPKYM